MGEQHSDWDCPRNDGDCLKLVGDKHFGVVANTVLPVGDSLRDVAETDGLST